MFHMHVRRLTRQSKQTALDCFNYIGRIDRYANRGDVVRTLESLHLPAWVDRLRAEEFWRQADSAAMRTNGRVLFSLDIAIPRILPVGQQNALVYEFVEHLSALSTGRQSTERLTVSYAFHEGIRKDDHLTGRLPNPHIHVLLSPSVVDGVSRSKELWFRRSDSKRTDTSGSPRSRYIGSKRWLMEVRESWAVHANRALQSAGLSLRLDHRSHADRGLLMKPTVHVGSKGMQLAQMGILNERIQRNLRFQEFNATLLRRQTAHQEFQAKVALRRRTLEANEDALRQSLFIATRELETDLASHPLAASIPDLVAACSVLVLPADWPTADMGSHSMFLATMADAVQSLLAKDWMHIRCQERYFFISTNCPSVIALDSTFIATDARELDSLAHFADLLIRLQLRKLRAFVQPHTYEMASSAFDSSGIEIDVSKMGSRTIPLLRKRMA